MSELPLPAGVGFWPGKINDNGVILGDIAMRSTNGSGIEHDEIGPVLFANGSVTLLRATEGVRDSFRFVDLNNRGQVVGYEPSGGGFSGYLLENGVATNLSVVGGESEFNRPIAINRFGSVVGGNLRAGGWGGTNIGGGANIGIGPPHEDTSGRAFLYRGGKIFDLQTTIPADSGWVLRDAYDINDRGQIIGSGVFNGESRSFLLTPTTPTTSR